LTDSTRRFSGRVENYVRYRPHYPAEVLDLLRRECGLTEESVVVDVGSGTGILSALFLDNGNRVFGVEPNDAMRLAGDRLLSKYGWFTSLAATAEATTLPNQSADFVVAGQAFHWFDAQRARDEFVRVLKPGGWTVLVWNTRRKTGTPFLEAYERLLNTFGTDYREVQHGRWGSPEAIRAFFRPATVEMASFDNHQAFDLDSLKGRLLSSSYAPAAGDPGHTEMLREIERIFRRYERDGFVVFEYDTEIYYGPLMYG
jgi:SAM-dependent methyltransferase